MELTILMPCLNEAETIEFCVREAKGYLEASGTDGEVLVADNGSDDGSQAMAEALGARVVHVDRKGYGAALSAGIKEARGRFVIMGDSDGSYDFAHLDPFLARLRGGAELVMGNRFLGGIEKTAMPPLHRYLGNPVLSGVGRLFFRTPIGDFHCGLRGFSRSAILGLHLDTSGMEFASEMVVKAALVGLRIDEVPTTLRPDGRSRPPHLRSWPDGWKHLKFLMTYAPHWLFYYPGLVILGFGALLFFPLLVGPVKIAGATLDTGALILASALVLIGFQMMCFYGIARLFAVRFGLLPTSARFERLRAIVSVDIACLTGAVFLLFGVAAALGATLWWAGQGWGDLQPGTIARPTAFAVVASSLGLQLITTGFLCALLNQRIDRDAR
ncbi:MAG: glycosyltransferase family 2 protein [Pseudomonadota bacterium]